MKISEDRIDRDFTTFRILEFSVISVALTSLLDKNRDPKPLTYEKMY